MAALFMHTDLGWIFVVHVMAELLTHTDPGEIFVVQVMAELLTHTDLGGIFVVHIMAKLLTHADLGGILVVHAILEPYKFVQQRGATGVNVLVQNLCTVSAQHTATPATECTHVNFSTITCHTHTLYTHECTHIHICTYTHIHTLTHIHSYTHAQCAHLNTHTHKQSASCANSSLQTRILFAATAISNRRPLPSLVPVPSGLTTMWYSVDWCHVPRLESVQTVFHATL